ncbi:hypothetical protein ANCDUO_01671 [Ancylostoma duodenale]|uniref:Uncharacterized protein n=1 Tax=Ancylostoma duodenale TaxID=51022 RepID=A0A0C2DYC1_9BILA|nr:hypothetical protein ANCDUO_01671 [Ancylostoma duodenale]
MTSIDSQLMANKKPLTHSTIRTPGGASYRRSIEMLCCRSVWRECWAAAKEKERLLGVIVMKMLCWIALFHAAAYAIETRLDVVAITDKLCEARLQWYGYVLHANNEMCSQNRLRF